MQRLENRYLDKEIERENYDNGQIGITTGT